MRHLKQATICLATLLIFSNSMLTMGNSCIDTSRKWGIEDLPKIENTYVPSPISLEILISNKEEAKQAEIEVLQAQEWYNSELAILQRIVESEATGEGMLGKECVANVILNRIKDERFPNTINGVVFAKNQFSPITDGRYDKAIISQETIDAIENVYNGNNQIKDAVYFFDMEYVTNKKTLKWIKSLKFVVKIGNHSFYK